MANNSLARLEVLIDEILNLTKIANLQEENVQIAVKDIILESCERASVIDDFLRINIDVDIPEDVRILNQARCFQTVTDNLISNAVKYQDKTIESSFLQISYGKVEGGHKLVFEDNGIGIPTQHQDKLFTMFKRFHPRTSFGSGLGLYLVKKSISKMGAEIEFHSTDEGSVFTLIFSD